MASRSGNTSRGGNTRARIQQAAMELFAERGVRGTALWQIAERLNITKPALYYYFDSREDLINSLVEPVIEDTEATLTALEKDPPAPAPLLERYYEMSIRHRDINLLVLRDLSLFTGTDLGKRTGDWRRRMVVLLVGADADLAAQARAVIAIGGIADCTVMFDDQDPDALRTAALAGARAVLGLVD